MRIVTPSVELLNITENAEALIERAGRTCYKSEDKITPESASVFIKSLLKRGHLSVIEHASATMKFICDCGVTHELVRHRLASYSQESTRYCDYGGEICVIVPPDIGNDTNDHKYCTWWTACRNAEISYRNMHAIGCPPQIARSVLPICVKTEIVVTANLREWMHILKLRTSKAAHPQIRNLMKIAEQLLIEKCPTIFAS